MNTVKGHISAESFFKTLSISKASFLAYYDSLNPFQIQRLEMLLSAIKPGLVPPLISLYADDEKNKFFRVRNGYYTIMEPYSIPYFEGLENLFNQGKKLDIELSVSELVEEAKKG